MKCDNCERLIDKFKECSWFTEQIAWYPDTAYLDTAAYATRAEANRAERLDQYPEPEDRW